MKLEYTQTHCHFMKNGECVALETTNCVNCKYRKHKCHLSNEKMRDTSFQGGMWGA